MSRALAQAGLFVPLGILLFVLLLGYWGFRLEDPQRLPSALLGKPFPEFQAKRLAEPDAAPVRRADLLGAPTLVNVWATWCPTCKAEHEQLLRIRAHSQVRIVGLNYKDDPAAALRWLRAYGDPYHLNLVDADGRLGVELGVYGAPETFLLDAAGIIRYKRVGELTPQVWLQEIAPRLQRMEAADGLARSARPSVKYAG